MAKKPGTKRVQVFYLETGPLLPLRKAQWVRLFVRYVRDGRLSITEIITCWNLATRGGWGKAVKRDKNYIAKMHQQIRGGLAKHEAMRDKVKFVRQTGAKKGFYRMSTT